MDGIINVSKPSGPTSFAIVAQLRRLTKEKRVGHGGTLDPLAAGVLPLFLGRATRLVEYLQEYPKTYLAGVTLGVATDTYDAGGRVVATADASGITSQAIAVSLDSFRGTITQIPPAYSAIKQNGRPLYELARQGLMPVVDPRQVSIYRLEIVDYQPPLLTLDIECSKGTYIRSLANDLGQILGVGAHLASLVRTAYGPFDINDAIRPERLTQAAAEDTLTTLVRPLDAVLAFWPLVTLTKEQEQDVCFGRQLALEAREARRLRAYDEGGHFLALLCLDSETGAWQPTKVFGTKADIQRGFPGRDVRGMVR